MIVEEMMTCNTCHAVKPETDFYFAPRHHGVRRMPACRSCTKEKTAKWARENGQRRAAINKRWRERHPDRWRKLTLAKYGIGPEEYDALLEAQEGKCAICGNAECATGQAMSVDHDHVNGRVRGLLCRKCNSGIGQFGDDIELVRRALTYLEERR